MSKIRILISSHSPCIPTGQAETLRLIFQSLLKRHGSSYEVFQLAQFHREELGPEPWPLFPTKRILRDDGSFHFPEEDRFGQESFETVVERVKPDIVFAFGDPQCVTHIAKCPAIRSTAVIFYLNFDGFPIPVGYPRVLETCNALYTMTEFSLNTVIGACATMRTATTGFVYSPVDTDRFRLLPSEKRLEVRKELMEIRGLEPSRFVIGWVGRNQWRKQTWVMYRVIHYLKFGAYLRCRDCEKVTLYGWNPVSREHKDEVKCKHCGSRSVTPGKRRTEMLLWCHMNPEGGDWSTRLLEEQFQIERGNDVVYTSAEYSDVSVDSESIANLYQVFDCLLYLSGGEGFGIPVCEAMASGVPVVYSNYSGHGELVSRGGGGIAVNGVLQPEKETCIWRMLANVDEAVSAVLSLAEDESLRTKIARQGRGFVETFDLDAQGTKWNQIFESQKNCWQRENRCAVALPAF